MRSVINYGIDFNKDSNLIVSYTRSSRVLLMKLNAIDRDSLCYPIWPSLKLIEEIRVTNECMIIIFIYL